MTVYTRIAIPDEAVSVNMPMLTLELTEAMEVTPRRPIDDPNHPHYGPCRRMHVILLHLFPKKLDSYEAAFSQRTGRTWEEFLISEIEWHGDESTAARQTLRWFAVL